jgi:uncharacterized membrane protein
MAPTQTILNDSPSATHRVSDIRAADDGFTINTLTTGDLVASLRSGLADFLAMPSHLLFIVAIYPIGAFLLAQLTYSLDLLPLFFPLIAGFAIVGPFVAVGLYEISRRRERGETVTWRDVLEIQHSPAWGSMLLVGLVLTAIFFAWLFAADRLYALIIGDRTVASVPEFLGMVLTTPEGWALIIVGHVVGFVFAALAFMLSAVSFPMLLDRPVGAGEAIAASVRTVRRNPGVMALWAATIAIGLMVGSALLFVGLVLVLPILGHASWHLYRRAIRWS